MSLLDVKSLKFGYQSDKKILHEINLNVNPGERLLLIGPNGCGKSTLLRILSGKHIARDVSKFRVLKYRTPQSGVGGVSYIGDEWKRSIGFVGSIAYTIDLKVKDFMKKIQEENKDRRNQLVKILKINLNWNMMELSDGQRRRVQIMLGLIQPFKVLFLDEVTSELDIVVRSNLMDYLKYETQENNNSIIYATHILDSLEDWITGILYINHTGRLEKINIPPNSDLKTTITQKMTQDYQIMESLNIEEIAGSKVFRSAVFGAQGGYASGRSQNIYK